MSHNFFDHRHYVVIPYSEVSNIDFDEVLETSANTIRLSVNRLKTFVKYEYEMPSSVAAVQDKSQEYSYEEICEILNTDEWTDTSL